jgi:hypothetical protein
MALSAATPAQARGRRLLFGKMNGLTPLEAHFKLADSAWRVFLWLLPRAAHVDRRAFQSDILWYGRDYQRTEQPIVARTVFEGEEEECPWLKLPFRIAPIITATRSRGLRSLVHADVLIRAMRGEGRPVLGEIDLPPAGGSRRTGEMQNR